MAKKILVIDDDIQLVSLIQIRLEANGYEVITAYDGREALEKIRGQMPDLIILDLILPRLPGEEVCREVRKDEKTKGIPIIMLTGKTSDTDRVVGRVIGADYYIPKPFETSVFLEKVKKLIGPGVDPLNKARA